MNQLKLLFASLVILALAVGLILQQRLLIRLRAENASLRQQLDQLGNLSAETERLSNSLAQAKSTLPEDQSRELLRLRGEVSGLRRQTNDLAKLQQENQRLREAQAAQSAKAATPDPSDEAQQAWRQTAVAKLNDSRLMVLSLLMYAADNGDVLSTNMNDLTNFLHGAQSTFTGTNEFDLLYHGSADTITNPSSVFIVRERTAIQRPDGRWVRAYGFADGHAEYHAAEPDGNFERWEKLHAPPGWSGP